MKKEQSAELLVIVMVFKTGEIVVALETDDVPYCAKESAYSPEKHISVMNQASTTL